MRVASALQRQRNSVTEKGTFLKLDDSFSRLHAITRKGFPLPGYFGRMT
jgi:hypothetical protein